MDIALIPCTKRKYGVPMAAKYLYAKSPLFRATFRYADRAGQHILIVSAKYGLVQANAKLEPYDFKVTQMSTEEKKQWAARVMVKLINQLQPGDRIFSYLGEDYAKHILPRMRERGFEVIEPLSGKRPGERMQWLLLQHADATAPFLPAPRGYFTIEHYAEEVPEQRDCPHPFYQVKVDWSRYTDEGGNVFHRCACDACGATFSLKRPLGPEDLEPDEVIILGHNA